MEENTPLYNVPLIGDKAPDMKVKTTHGWLQLSEYGKDSWMVLFSHPADFTPVCTTELSGFAARKKEFDALNTKLIGLSIDSVFSHLGWVQNVKEKTGVDLDFPIIADITMDVAKAFGMIHPKEAGVATVRAVYFIDPTMTIRLIMYYPLNVGRNMDEIIRVLQAMQTVDREGVVCPLNWEPGKPALNHPPETYAGVSDRMKENNPKTVDWYLQETEAK